MDYLLSSFVGDPSGEELQKHQIRRPEGVFIFVKKLLLGQQKVRHTLPARTTDVV